ncbi:MAG: hypothetical protein FWG87_05445 [Defluviitaleaceae bacterium]|nr:hypothetical protein [Defluviitaleaceae bacterium]
MNNADECIFCKGKLSKFNELEFYNFSEKDIPAIKKQRIDDFYRTQCPCGEKTNDKDRPSAQSLILKGGNELTKLRDELIPTISQYKSIEPYKSTDETAQEITKYIDDHLKTYTKDGVKKILDKASSEKNDIFKLFCDKFALSEHDYMCFDCERIVFIRTKNSHIDSLFAHIRNALSHGKVWYKNESLFMVDCDSRQKLETARICIKIDTLLEWIKIIKKYEKKESNKK